MIIRKFLFQKFHHPRHDKIEDVVENTGGDERNHRGLTAAICFAIVNIST